MVGMPLYGILNHERDDLILTRIQNFRKGFVKMVAEKEYDAIWLGGEQRGGLELLFIERLVERH